MKTCRKCREPFTSEDMSRQHCPVCLPNTSRLLRQAQEVIITLCRNPYYAQAYKAAEPYYWQMIPGWINEDFSFRNHNLNCLDIGCGYGTLAVYCKLLLGCQIFCINHPSEPNNMDEQIIKKFDIDFYLLDVEAPEVKAVKCFDIVIFTEILEHLNFHPVQTLQKIKDSMRDGGRLYLSTPNVKEWGRLSFYQSWEDMPKVYEPGKALDTQHHYHYSESELRDLLDKTGFNILRLVDTGRHFNITAEVKK